MGGVGVGAGWGWSWETHGAARQRRELQAGSEEALGDEEDLSK